MEVNQVDRGNERGKKKRETMEWEGKEEQEKKKNKKKIKSDEGNCKGMELAKRLEPILIGAPSGK